MPIGFQRRGLSSLRRQKRKVVLQPPRIKRHPILDDIKRRYSSNTTLNSRLAKMKASDPVGMLKYQRKLQNSSPTTANIMSSNYQRSLYRPLV